MSVIATDGHGFTQPLGAAQASLAGAVVIPAKDNVESLKAAIRTWDS